MLTLDPQLHWLLTGVALLLLVASAIGFLLAQFTTQPGPRQVIANLNARTRAWWVMFAIFALALLCGSRGSILLFALISFLALREFITLAPTRRGDHHTLFWAFFIFVPVQYLLIAARWYGLFTIFIPVYAFLFIPVRSAITGDLRGFLERAAKIQWGLMICVYCLSHAPALLMLEIPNYAGQQIKLLFFLILIAQLSDVMQYVFGKTLGKRKIAPAVSPNKTIEGFVGGILTTTLVGGLLWWSTPFTPVQAALLALAIALAGFAGGLCMSAIKRDRGIKDFGTMISGHGGILDRLDSICYAAPVFFHLVRYFFT